LAIRMCSYGLAIRMCSYGLVIHTDRQSVTFLRTSSSPATKIDQNPPYTPHQRMYTTGEQIHFQTVLNGSNAH